MGGPGVTVCGIDLSSFAVDVVFIRETGRIDWHRFPLVGQDAWERTRSVRQVMPGPTSELWDEVIAIGIEQPAGHHGVIPLVRVQGAILCMLPPATLVHPYMPARWRVLAGLPGHAPKVDVAARSVELGAPDTFKQDAHDAHLVARAILADITSQEKAA